MSDSALEEDVETYTEPFPTGLENTLIGAIVIPFVGNVTWSTSTTLNGVTNSVTYDAVDFVGGIVCIGAAAMVVGKLPRTEPTDRSKRTGLMAAGFLLGAYHLIGGAGFLG